jgi:hypothetical protein
VSQRLGHKRHCGFLLALTLLDYQLWGEMRCQTTSSPVQRHHSTPPELRLLATSHVREPP